MTKRQRPSRSDDSRHDLAGELRIIGGQFRGSRLAYHGDPITRPMKHRVREAIFNLVGADVVGKHAIDVFAGTGAIGLEALSRGASSATFIERHVPAARVVQENIEHLGVADRCELLCTSAFLWARLCFGEQASRAMDDFRLQIADCRSTEVPKGAAWAVFCSPPYDFFIDRQVEMIELIGRLLAAAPPESVFVVEADERLDFRLLPTPRGLVATAPDGAAREGPAGLQAPAHRAPDGAWRVRSYPPAQIGVLRVLAASQANQSDPDSY